MSDNYGNIYDADPHISVGMGRSYANKTISVNALEMQGLRSSLNANIADLHNLNAMVLTAENNLGDEVLARHNISENLARLRRYIEESENNLTSNYNGLATVMNGFDSADKAIANSFGGVNYQANSMLIAQQYGNYVPVNINGQIILMSIDQINAIYGLESNSQKRGTDLNIFQQIGKGIADTWNKATSFVTNNADKLIATAFDLGSIALSAIAGVGAFVGATAATGLTFGAGVVTYGGAAICITMAGNNIANRWTDIWHRWDENDALIGNVNYLKEGLSNAGGYVGSQLGDEELGRWIGGTAIYGGMEVVSALQSADNVSKGLSWGASKLGAAADTTSKVLSSNVTKQTINILNNRSGLSDNKGAMAKETLDLVSNKMYGEGVKNGEWLENLTNTGFDVYNAYKDIRGGNLASAFIQNDLISNGVSFADNLAGTIKSPLIIESY